LFASHSSYAELELPKLERKIRLLTLASIGFQNTGQDLAYSKIAASLQIELSEVEVWVIDGVSPSPFMSRIVVDFRMRSHSSRLAFGKTISNQPDFASDPFNRANI
jgi:hypothetical protein